MKLVVIHLVSVTRVGTAGNRLYPRPLLSGTQRETGVIQRLRGQRDLPRMHGTGGEPERTSTCALIINPGEKVVLLGQAAVSVLDGCINVFGKNVQRGDMLHRIISPPRNSLLFLVNPSESEVAQVCFSSIRDGLEDMRLGNGSSVLGLSEGDSETFRLNPVGDYNHLVIPDDWSRTCSTLGRACQEGNPVLLVCGPRKVGKSTFCRLLVNTLLNYRDQICHMDLDPGQTEFMPPGFITLEPITEPLTSPPFGHACSAKHNRYLGFSSVEESPEYYFKCCKSLFETFQSQYSSHHPLIINTMGWVTGLGLQLLQAVLQTVRPTHIVSFDGVGRGRDAPHGGCVPEYVEQAMFSPCSIFSGMQFSPLSHEQLSLQATISPVSGGPGTGGVEKGSLSPRQRRDLMWSAYFRRTFEAPGLMRYDFTRSMSLFKPFRVSWDQIVVALTPTLGARVPKRHVPTLLIGSVVGLCRSITDSGGSLARSPSVLPILYLRPDDEPVNCLGAALVRSIDMKMRTIEIWTPHDLEFLRENLLYTLVVHPGFTIPSNLFLQEGQASGPYLSAASTYSSALAPHIRKVRTNIRRKWQPNPSV